MLQCRKVKKSGGFFDSDNWLQRLDKLKQKSASPNFWNNNENASNTLKKISNLEKRIALWKDLDRRYNDLNVLFEFAENGEIDNKELKNELKSYKKIIDDLEIKLILGRPEDEQNAIVSIHPGAGGTESQDWAQMLFRMYRRWIEKESLEYEIIDFQPGEEAGIKDVTFEVKGDYAFGLLKAEAGVHRMVRLSPFDTNNRRHTSFASLFVYPAADGDIDININPSDLRIDTYRASGAGGQHVNKTDSAVRITHIPSGIVSQCQNERSQHKNKNQAMKILKARLYQIEIDKEKEKNKKFEDKKMEIGWGSQIRSYVFHPYQLVKDHRTNVENGNTQGVMDGNLNPFIKSYLLNIIRKK
tara:strand:- start:1578 stop:2648 length:1071 start_codon:yes stop_codon:yes gene_type:complete